MKREAKSQTKILENHHLTVLRTATVENCKCWQECGKCGKKRLEPLCTGGVNVKWCSTYQKWYGFDPAIRLPGMYPKN